MSESGAKEKSKGKAGEGGDGGSKGDITGNSSGMAASDASSSSSSSGGNSNGTYSCVLTAFLFTCFSKFRANSCSSLVVVCIGPP